MKVWNGYQKGVNLGGWLSQCDYSLDRLENFIKEEDLKKIASWGCDHVRVPVDYNIFQDENGNLKESGFVYTDRVIAWCEKYNLNMILDLHKTAGYSFDKGEKQEGFFESKMYQERFYSLWEEFARRYGKYSNRLAFELLNEITDKETIGVWREISQTCIDRIRAIAKDSYILLGSYWNNHVTAMVDLQMPSDDKIVYNFHCYDPVIITHQGAYWVDGMDLDFRFEYDNTYEEYYRVFDEIFGDLWGGLHKVADPTKKFGADYFDLIMGPAAKLAEERNVALYCGEYGVIELASPQTILAWYKDINSIFTKYGIGRSAWCYKGMDYDLQGPHLDSIRDELVKVL